MDILGNNKKIYFASDVHLGMPSYEKGLWREKLFVKWLDKIKSDAEEIYLLGDIFDFWYEYKRVVPRGFTRLLGKLSEICDSGIPVHFFTGNHDIWVFDYLQKETGVILYRKPLIKTINGKKFFLAHGDGLGPYDKKFKLMKSVFTNKIAQWMFSRLHPNFSIAIGNYWSVSNRTKYTNPKFLGEDKEWLILFAKSVLEKEHFDFFIFGHRHLPIEIMLNQNSKYINLGDWLQSFTYGVFDGNNVSLEKFIDESS